MTPERRAELRALAMQAVAADYIEVIALLDALDLADARERRLREALEIALDMIHKLNGTFVPGNDAAGTEAADTCREIAAVLRKHAALSEVAPDAR